MMLNILSIFVEGEKHLTSLTSRDGRDAGAVGYLRIQKLFMMEFSIVYSWITDSYLIRPLKIQV